MAGISRANLESFTADPEGTPSAMRKALGGHWLNWPEFQWAHAGFKMCPMSKGSLGGSLEQMCLEQLLLTLLISPPPKFLILKCYLRHETASQRGDGFSFLHIMLTHALLRDKQTGCLSEGPLLSGTSWLKERLPKQVPKVLRNLFLAKDSGK